MEELARLGGRPVCGPGTIPRWPAHGSSERDGLLRVLASSQWWRGAGTEVEAFEREFAAAQECRHALAVTNGTHAIEIALACLDVGAGDEVIIPACTFVATATAVLSVGAIPVPVDVDLQTYCIDPAAVEAALTPATRAIMPVHFAGQACDMTRLLALSSRCGVPILSDSAHAHGTRWQDTPLAKLSAVTAFSFQSSKLLTAGEGGAIVTDDPGVAQRAWLRHTYGRPKGDRTYQHLEMGTNARMTEFQGALLRAQLMRLPGQLVEREHGAARLTTLLADIPGVTPASRLADVSMHSHYMYMVMLDERSGLSRDLVLDALVAEGVPAYRAYPAIPDLEMFRCDRLGASIPPATRARVHEALNRHPVPNSRAIASRALWLHHPVLLGTARTQELVAQAFRKVVHHRGRLMAALAPAAIA